MKPPRATNHQPIAVCNGDVTRNCLRVQAQPGDEVRLTSAGSHDPDGHGLSCRWWFYREAGTFHGPVMIAPPDGPETHVAIPATASGCEIHIILELTDDGSPPLTSYRRAVIRTD